MTHYKATPYGLVPFTPEEEVQYKLQLAQQAAMQPELNRQANKQQAEQLLQATDWVEVPSVSNTANTPHLINYQEFITYRLAVRAIAVNPPTEPATFPTKPEENWSSV